MSIAAQCSECCDCPTPTTQWDSVSASKTKFGIAPYDGSDPTHRYRDVTISGYANIVYTPLPSCRVDSLGTASGGVTDYGDASQSGTLQISDGVTTSDITSQAADCALPPAYGGLGGTPPTGSMTLVSTPTTCRIYWDYDAGTDGYCNPVEEAQLQWSSDITKTISNLYTTDDLITNTVAALPAFDDDWNDTAGSFANLSTDELSYAARKSRYRHIFPVPKVGSGTCYRLEWVERFIAEAGVALDSAEIVTRGVARPTVSYSGGGGTGGLVLVAVMASDGSISAVRILNPGDFDTAPTITIQTAINGGTTSTGWTATLTGRQVTSVTRSGGSAGDYLPTGAFSGGGGTGATITFTVDETGGLATCPIGSGGSGYTSEPTLTITPKVSGSLAARVDLHLGTETAMCAEWDGVTPPGYDPASPATWPILGDGTNPYFELPVPTADGTTLVANVRAYCDCSACPP